MLTDGYGHVVIDSNGDEWRAFWLAAYDRQRRPKLAESRPGVVSGGGKRLKPLQSKKGITSRKLAADVVSVDGQCSFASSWMTTSAVRPT